MICFLPVTVEPFQFSPAEPVAYELSKWREEKIQGCLKGDNLMNYSLLRLIFKALFTFILLVIFNSSALAGDSTTFKSGNESEREQRQFKYKNKKGGLPIHASAHGYRAKHQYRYYPIQKVYHDTDRGLYFYQKGDNWEVDESLPSRLKTSLGEFVTITLDSDKPYAHNSDHIEKYQPENSNKAKENLLAKLIYVLLYEYANK
jgi:hypothetical protein